MNRLYVFLILILFLFVGCGRKNPSSTGLTDWMEASQGVKVLSTTAMIEDLVKQVGGEHIHSLCLIVGDLDPHSYELIKGDDEKLQRADLIFYNGLGLEHGASVLHYLRKGDKSVSVGEEILKKFPERLIKVEGQIDPHIWMDMELFSEIIDPIVIGLSLKDPSHRLDYQKRGEELKKELKEKDQNLREKMQQIPEEKRYLVTSHDAFHYFAKQYLAPSLESDWEKRVQAPEGLAPEGQMSVFDIQKVTNFLCENQVGVVFPESNVSPEALKKIVSVCGKRGLKVEVAKASLYGDTMAGAGSYIEMMEHNIETLTTYMMREHENSAER
jgi:manganese/zinc/iron transport system substrate-binding protein